MLGRARPWAVKRRSRASPERVRVEEIGESDLDEYVSVELRGWSLPGAEHVAQRNASLTALRASERMVPLFAARLDGQVVGTSALVLRGSYAYLLATQVLGTARGQGVYRALVQTRLSFLEERGISYAVTQAREATSAPMLEHLGFETPFRSHCWLRDDRSPATGTKDPTGRS